MCVCVCVSVCITKYIYISIYLSMFQLVFNTLKATCCVTRSKFTEKLHKNTRQQELMGC